MESVHVRIPAQTSTTVVVGHLAFGDMVHRATFTFDTTMTLTTGAAVQFNLYQYRSGNQIGSSLAMLSLANGATVYSSPLEFTPPWTPDTVQFFEDLDTMILVVAQGSTPTAFTGLLSWR